MDAVKIMVVQKRTSRIAIIIVQGMFWALLVGAIGLSRIWFGGAWIIDLIAAFLSMFALLQAGKLVVGHDVVLTVAETRLWLAAGAPRDVLEWKNAQKRRAA